MTYNQKNQNLFSVRAYYNDTLIVNIIKYCQLKHTTNWRKWCDDYGNLFKIKKDHIEIIYNQDINYQTITISDLYAKANIEKLSSICKYALIAFNENNYYIWTLDQNNILRLSWYVNDILMENQPILISGIKNLKRIIANSQIENWQEVSSITEPLTNDLIKSYATRWPPSKELIDLLPEIIKKDCNLA